MMDLSVRILRTGVLALVCATLICSTATIRATHEANTATWTFGGSGGASKLGSPVGGTWYGRLDLAELGTSGGPRAGSGGGAANRGAAGSGGGPKPEQAMLIIFDPVQANDKATLQIQITDLQGRVMFKQAFA